MPNPTHAHQTQLLSGTNLVSPTTYRLSLTPTAKDNARMIDLTLHHYPYEMEYSQRSATTPFASTASHRPPAPESANTSFAFLVHSQDTIPHNLPPSVDNKPLARQRRRRTSPEDQNILEEEFLRDSKPDKAARARIVQRVALGEKEVQIWFQNRRQNSRRKTRPLLPHEILSHLQNVRSVAAGRTSISPRVPSAVATAARTSSEFDVDENGLEDFVDATDVSSGSITSPLMRNTLDQQPAYVVGPAEEIFNNGTNDASDVVIGLISGGSVSSGVDQFLASTVESPRSEACQTGVDGIITRGDDQDTARENVEPQGLAKQEVDEPTQATASEEDQGQARDTLKRSTSRVRLSMTSDGAAKIITGDESSPSPPRSQIPSTSSSARQNSLRRSYSAAGLNETFASSQSSAQVQGLRRVPSGRSRDSRAWEFWCDNDVRNELVKKADQENTGSAADAISLMRSSSRGPLTPNPSKGNVSLIRHASVKRAKTDSHAMSKPLLGRTKSSIATFRDGSIPVSSLCDDKEVATADKPKKEVIEVHIGSSGESDKENNDPETQSHGVLWRIAHPNRGLGDHRRPILEEHRSVPSRNNSLKMILNGDHEVRHVRERKTLAAPARENVDPERDDEIASFMRPGRESGASTSPAADDDMDCIQGLLSLSQGAWR